MLQWEHLGSKSSRFRNYIVQVLPESNAAPNGVYSDLRVVLDAEVTANIFQFSPESLQPIDGSLWNPKEQVYKQYNSGTTYCVRVGMVEAFSDPFQSTNDGVFVSKHHTHRSMQCHEVDIGTTFL